MRRRAGAVSHLLPAAPQPPLGLCLRRTVETPQRSGGTPPPPGVTLAQPWVLERLLGAQARQQGSLPMNFSCLCLGSGRGSLPQRCCDAAVINVRSESRTRPVSAAAEQLCQFVEAREPPSPQASSCPGFWKGLGDGGQALQTCCAGAPREAGIVRQQCLCPGPWMAQVPPRAGRVIWKKGPGHITVTAKVTVVMMKMTVMMGVTLRKVEVTTTAAHACEAQTANQLVL